MSNAVDDFRDNYFYTKRNKQEILQRMRDFFGDGWQMNNAKILFEKAGKILGVKTEIKNGIGNDEIPRYQANMSPSVCLIVCNEKIPCGEQQILFFVLDKMISRDILTEINKGPYLFEIDSGQQVTSRDDEDREYDTIEKMSDYPELYENVKIVWEMLRSK